MSSVSESLECTCTTYGHCAACRPRNDRRPVTESDLEPVDWAIRANIELTPLTLAKVDVALWRAGVRFGDTRAALFRVLDALHSSLEAS